MDSETFKPEGRIRTFSNICPGYLLETFTNKF